MSFSLEEDIKRDFAAWAKRVMKSKSDLFRDMVARYQFNEQCDFHSYKSGVILDSLGIQSELELYACLESDDTYRDGIRHQPLPGSNKEKKLRQRTNATR